MWVPGSQRFRGEHPLDFRSGQASALEPPDCLPRSDHLDLDGRGGRSGGFKESGHRTSGSPCFRKLTGSEGKCSQNREADR